MIYNDRLFQTVQCFKDNRRQLWWTETKHNFRVHRHRDLDFNTRLAQSGGAMVALTWSKNRVGFYIINPWLIRVDIQKLFEVFISDILKPYPTWESCFAAQRFAQKTSRSMQLHRAVRGRAVPNLRIFLLWNFVLQLRSFSCGKSVKNKTSRPCPRNTVLNG